MNCTLAARRQMSRVLGRAAGGITWLLRDDFVTDLPAGSVNDTAAEPGPGTRVVVDTANKLWLESGKLRFALRDPHITGDPGLWLSGPIQRVAGRMAIFDIPTNYSNFWVGWDTNLTGSMYHGFYWYDHLRIDSVSGPIIQSMDSSSYMLTSVLRDNGAFYFKKQPSVSSKWLLSWINSSGTVSPLYITVAGYYHAPTVSRIGVPDALWLPTPLVSDGFGAAFGTTDGLGHAEGIAGGIGAGGAGVAWSNVGSTWSVSGGKAINTPNLGANVVTNSGFDVDANWSKGAGWSIASGKATHAPGSATSITTTTLSSNKFYRFSLNVVARASSINLNIGDSSDRNITPLLSTGTFSAVSRSYGSLLRAFAQSAYDGDIDDFTGQEIILAEMISVANASVADVYVGADIVQPSDMRFAGIALSWDSSTNPQNGVLVALWKNYGFTIANIVVMKMVNGAISEVSSTAYTYISGAQLVVCKSGTKYRVYYNSAFIVEFTVSDAGIINNTLHGMFSTDTANTLDNFVCYPTGTGGEYATLDQYTQA